MLRGVVAHAYAEVVSRSEPPDQVLAGFFRVHEREIGGGRGFVAATCYSWIRLRARTLAALAGTEPGDQHALTTSAWPWPAPRDSAMREALCAYVRWEIEDQETPPEEVVERTARVAEQAARRDARRAPSSGEEAGAPSWPAPGEAAAFAQNWIERLAALPSPIAADGKADAAMSADQLAARTGWPADLIARWSAYFGADAALQLARRLTEPAPLVLRCDQRVESVESVLGKLAEAGLPEGRATRFAPEGVVMSRKANLRTTGLIHSGALAVQDEGSQLVSLAVDPAPGWQVLDACAGGGGKALHLAPMLARTEVDRAGEDRYRQAGRVFAYDSDPERLDGLRRRISPTDERRILLFEQESEMRDALGDAAGFDAVLLDAPCLGLGTLRRRPHLAWIGGALDARVIRATTAQDEILDRYSAWVKPGGVLVYAVCSIDPDETVARVASFLERHPEFHFEAPTALLERLGDVAPSAYFLERDQGVFLLPHVLAAPDYPPPDGFYISRLRRRAE